VRRLAAAAAAGMAAVVMAAAPATAATTTVHDKVGDDALGNGNGDVRWVRVQYGAHRLTVTIKSPASGNPEYYQDLYVDVRRKESRPDLVITSNGDWQGWSAGFVSGWHNQGYRERCSGGPGSVDYDAAHHVVRYHLPVTCLMHRGAVQPKRLRVSLVTRTETERATDWVPSKRHFGPWVAWR
jgi:hypothetical protein